MSELGELLELLHGARRRFRTARGVLVHRQSDRLTMEATRREHERMPARRRGSMRFTSMSSGGEEQPDLREERVRFWWQPPDRLREETESSRESQTRTVVVDGELWWLFSPWSGAISNVFLDEEERAHHGVGTGERFRPLLDPRGLSAVLDFDRLERDGGLLRVQARVRDDVDDHALFHLPFARGADAYELAIDRESGIVHSVAAFLDGEEIWATELEEIAFDEEFPEGTFVFVPPPGEELRPPGSSVRRDFTLEEAAAGAPFPLFSPPELPEGNWRLRVMFHEARERPPAEANAALLYHRADGRGSLVISQRADDGQRRFGWAGIGPPELEEVERDGVRYTVCCADEKRGGQHGVAFERDSTAIQLQSQELDVDALLALAATLVRVEPGA